jgi:surface antigen
MTRAEAVNALLVASKVDVDNNTQEVPRGSNWGPRVKQMLANVGIYDPAYWCMAAVWTWFEEAGLSRYGYRSGLCQDIYNWAKRKGILSKTPQVGDIMLIWASDRSRVNHTGIVIKVNGDGTVTTVEGNTNDAGSRNGYEVCKRVRTITSRLVFVHWQTLVPITNPETSYKLQIGAKLMTKVHTDLHGDTWLNLRSYLSMLFTAKQVEEGLLWDEESNQPLWNKKDLPEEVEFKLVEGESYIRTRPALGWMGLEVSKITEENVIVAVRKAS